MAVVNFQKNFLYNLNKNDISHTYINDSKAFKITGYGSSKVLINPVFKKEAINFNSYFPEEPIRISSRFEKLEVLDIYFKTLGIKNVHFDYFKSILSLCDFLYNHVEDKQHSNSDYTASTDVRTDRKEGFWEKDVQYLDYHTQISYNDRKSNLYISDRDNDERFVYHFYYFVFEKSNNPIYAGFDILEKHVINGRDFKELYFKILELTNKTIISKLGFDDKNLIVTKQHWELFEMLKY